MENNNNFLVSFNQNQKLEYHEIKIVDGKPLCIPIYEDLLFCALFLDGQRILTPQTEEQKYFFEIFTKQERYLIASETFDGSLIKRDEFRKQNTSFCPYFTAPIIQIATIHNFYNESFGSMLEYYLLDPELNTKEIKLYGSFDGVNWLATGLAFPAEYLEGDFASKFLSYSYEGSPQYTHWKLEETGVPNPRQSNIWIGHP